jgi:hypothetical protein
LLEKADVIRPPRTPSPAQFGTKGSDYPLYTKNGWTLVRNR